MRIYSSRHPRKLNKFLSNDYTELFLKSDFRVQCLAGRTLLGLFKDTVARRGPFKTFAGTVARWLTLMTPLNAGICRDTAARWGHFNGTVERLGYFKRFATKVGSSANAVDWNC